MAKNLLQKYYFVPLDIFCKNIHNKDIKSKIDAWLVFLTCDEPEMIIKLIWAYPEFKRLYEEIYELCRNIEEVMNMFSKELQEIDRNTAQYMIDQMQDDINELTQTVTEKDKELAQKIRETKLYDLLSDDKRWDDLARALKDEEFRRKLAEEYQVE